MENLAQIYVALLGEGVDVWRPVQAIHERGDLYRIISPNPDAEDERWQFSSGDVVRCERRAFSSGGEGLVAYAKAGGDA